MKMSKIAAFAAAGALAACCFAVAGCGSNGDADLGLITEGTLTVATSPDYPPFENLEGDEIVGFEADLWNALGEKMGLAVEAKAMNFDGILTAVAAGGQCDLGISGFSIDPERAKTVNFSDSYYIDDLAIAAMKDGKFATEEALAGKDVRFAAQSGTTGESYIQENYPDAQVIAFTNSNDCFAAMAAGKVDAVCTNDAVVSSMVANSYTDAAIVTEIATGEEYGIAVNMDNEALLAAVNDALAEMQEDGTLQEIMNKWF